jgi:hypothetical protein
VPPKRSAAHYLWAVLIARIYEMIPLLCPLCGDQMRIIAFITHSADIRQILDHLGVQAEPPCISPARGAPLWDDHGDAQLGEGAQGEPDWDLVGQPARDSGVGLRASQAQNQLASSGFTTFSVALAETVQTAEICGF